MTDTTSRTVLQFPERREPRKPPLRLVHDCQNEGRTLTSLKGSVLALNPTGMDIDELLAVQAKERLVHRAKEAWRNWRDATDAVLSITGIPGDPAEQMVNYIENAKGKSAL